MTAGCPEELVVRADPEKLRQVLVNLLSNAVKFTDPGGAIRVGCEELGGAVAVRVRDTGIGIPPDRMEAVFEPFVQVRSDLTRTAEGTGLGLAISRDLARGMGGDLTGERTPGEGSVFTLTCRAPSRCPGLSSPRALLDSLLRPPYSPFPRTRIPAAGTSGRPTSRMQT